MYWPLLTCVYLYAQKQREVWDHDQASRIFPQLLFQILLAQPLVKMSHFFGVLFLLSFLTQFCVYGFHGVLIVLCWGKFFCSGLVRCPEEKTRSLRDDYVVTAWQLEVLPCWSQNLWGKLSRSPQCLLLQCPQCRKFHIPFRFQFTFCFIQDGRIFTATRYEFQFKIPGRCHSQGSRSIKFW